MSNNEFGELLARARAARGFPTPYAFYQAREGEKNLGMSFANYLLVERGRQLPEGWRFEGILRALNLGSHDPRTRELVRAYFAALLGSPRLLTALDAAEVPTGAPAPSPSVALSLEQWKILAGDPAALACHAFLAAAPGWTARGRISQATGLAPAAVVRALKALAGGGLCERSGDRARSPLYGKRIQELPLNPATASLHAKLHRTWSAWTASGARRIYANALTTRATGVNIAQYLPHLEEAAQMAQSFADQDGADAGPLYLLEARVIEVFS